MFVFGFDAPNFPVLRGLAKSAGKILSRYDAISEENTALNLHTRCPPCAFAFPPAFLLGKSTKPAVSRQFVPFLSFAAGELPN
jgi:hypothetical protein